MKLTVPISLAISKDIILFCYTVRDRMRVSEHEAIPYEKIRRKYGIRFVRMTLRFRTHRV